MTRSLSSGFCVLLFTFVLSPFTLAGTVVDRLEASVNAQTVLSSDIQKFKSTVGLRQQLDPLFNNSPIAAKAAQANNQDVVNFLIDEHLIAQAFPISDSDVEQEISSIQANNHITRDGLKAALKEQGFTFDNYFEMIRASLAKRNLIDRDIRTKVSISDDDVKNHFYNTLAGGAGKSLSFQYHFKMISLSSKAFKNTTALREAAQSAMKDIRSGEAFEEVAKRVSDDASAANGGDFGFIADDQISPKIRGELQRLQIGQISDLVGEAKSGFFILKLVDKKSNDEARLQKVREEIRGQLVAAEYQRQIQLWLERQRQKAFIHRQGEPLLSGLPVVNSKE